MKLGYKQWTVAFALSAFAHVAVASLFQPQETTIEIAGGSPVVLALAGNSFADMVVAGEAADTLDPVTEPVSEVAAPVETAMASEVVETASVPVAPETVKPVEATPPVDAVEIPQAAAEPAIETARPVEMPVAAVSEIEPIVEVASVDADVAIAAPPPVLQQAEPDPVVLDNIPVPVARPEPKPELKTASAAQKPRPVKAAKTEKKRVKPKPVAKAKPQAGNGGQSNANASKGGAKAVSGNSSRAGNAAVSNYPGKVAGKLRRAVRYPREARSKRIRGEAVVSFVVASSGSVSRVRLVRSSGSPLLDTAAIDTVRRAAPFPPIPGGAGKSSWPFSVPVAFNR